MTDTIKTKKTLLVGSRHPGSRLKAIVDDVQIYKRKLEQSEVQQIAKTSPVSALLAIADSERTAAQNETIKRHYLINEDQAIFKTHTTTIEPAGPNRGTEETNDDSDGHGKSAQASENIHP